MQCDERKYHSYMHTILQLVLIKSPNLKYKYIPAVCRNKYR